MAMKNLFSKKPLTSAWPEDPAWPDPANGDPYDIHS
jgi:hypothetical protein